MYAVKSKLVEMIRLLLQFGGVDIHHVYAAKDYAKSHELFKIASELEKHHKLVELQDRKK